MLAHVRTTVLPEFGVYVYPTYEGERSVHQRYLLVLQDGTSGTLQLEFLSAQNLRAFLTVAREAFLSAQQELKVRKARQRQTPLPEGQTTLF